MPDLLLAAGAALAVIAPLAGDFDHDGLADRAWLREAGAGHELVIERGAGGTVVVDRIDDPRHFYLDVLAAGTLATACGKGLGPDDAPCPERSVTVAEGTLQFGTEEASQAAALWDGGRFRVVWLSD